VKHVAPLFAGDATVAAGDPRLALPARTEAAAKAQAKLAAGEKITPAEQRLLVFALPRKTRRANKIKTTDVRETLDALVTMRVQGMPGEDPKRERNRAKAARRRRREHV